MVVPFSDGERGEPPRLQAAEFCVNYNIARCRDFSSAENDPNRQSCFIGHAGCGALPNVHRRLFEWDLTDANAELIAFNKAMVGRIGQSARSSLSSRPAGCPTTKRAFRWLV
jgi:hypothetical protein